MSNFSIILIGLIIAVLLSSIFVGHFRIRIFPVMRPVLMYHRIDLKKRKITVIPAFAMHRETLLLKNNSFRLLLLNDLEAFDTSEGCVPCECYFIAMQDLYSSSLQKALPLLLSDQFISIFIYLPIVISSNHNQYHRQLIQQLNNFVFSKDFKDIFAYN